MTDSAARELIFDTIRKSEWFRQSKIPTHEDIHKTAELLSSRLVELPRSEEWKPIPNWDGYSASTWGRIRNDKTGRILKLFISNGYFSTCLSKKNVHKSVKVHSIVAEVFLGAREPSMVINHIDSNSFNNRVDNLEYVTHQQNVHHAVLNGTHPTGKRNGSYKHGGYMGRQFLGKRLLKKHWLKQSSSIS